MSEIGKVQNPGSLDDGKGLTSGFATALMATLVAGVWVTAAASVLYDNGSTSSYVAYAISVGVVGIVFALLGLLMTKNEKMEKKNFGKVKGENITTQKLLAVFLVLWWGCGAGIGTFKSPFTTTTNGEFAVYRSRNRPYPTWVYYHSPPLPGYFALWVGFLFSLRALGSVMDSVPNQLPKIGTPARGLFFAAVVLLVACIPHVEAGSNYAYFGEGLFGLIGAAVTVAITAGLILVENIEEKVAKCAALVLGLLWVALAGILTFRAPFVTTGNGYFSAYAGLFMAFQVFSHAFLEK